MTIIHYRGYAIETNGIGYRLKISPLTIYPTYEKIKEAIDKLISNGNTRS